MATFMQDYYNVSAQSITGSLEVSVTGLLRVPELAIQECGWRAAATLGAIISACDHKSHKCYASESTIGDWVGRTRMIVGQHIQTLLERGYIQEVPNSQFATKAYKLTPKVKMQEVYSYDSEPAIPSIMYNGFIPVYRKMVEGMSLSTAMIYGVVRKMSTREKVESERSLASVPIIMAVLGMTRHTVYDALNGPLAGYVEAIEPEKIGDAVRYVAIGI